MEIDWADALVGVGGSDDEKEHAWKFCCVLLIEQKYTEWLLFKSYPVLDSFYMPATVLYITFCVLSHLILTTNYIHLKAVLL